MTSSNSAIKLTNVLNPWQLPVAGIAIKGYPVRDRNIMGVCSYTALTTFTETVISGSQFVITNLEYEANSIPINVVTKYRIQI